MRSHTGMNRQELSPTACGADPSWEFHGWKDEEARRRQRQWQSQRPRWKCRQNDKDKEHINIMGMTHLQVCLTGWPVGCLIVGLIPGRSLASHLMMSRLHTADFHSVHQPLGVCVCFVPPCSHLTIRNKSPGSRLKAHSCKLLICLPGCQPAATLRQAGQPARQQASKTKGQTAASQSYSQMASQQLDSQPANWSQTASQDPAKREPARQTASQSASTS